MSARRQRHRIHGNPFHVRGPVEVPRWETIFERRAPMALDIGFGAGGFLLDLAARHPAWNVVGLEIRQHLVDQVLAVARERELQNVHALKANANLHLGDLFDDGTLVFVSLNFPDPWYKKRHHKRRVLNTPWLDQLAPKMAPKATFHYTTDYEPAAQEASTLLEAHPRFEADSPGFLPASSTEISTERERTHEKRGDPIFRLMFRRV